MSSKRSTGVDSGVSAAAAPARAKAKATRKHTIAATTETSDSAVASPEVTSTATSPTFEAIAHLAYSYWEARGYQDGSPEEDWLRAEAELAR